ncbi:MAG: hypothetical protein LBM93_13745 [Oscillospiraceae bacterium]|jgi:hypothetical protein|nr:hypothetical protein [Oscillospiraceae bacterium]
MIAEFYLLSKEFSFSFAPSLVGTVVSFFFAGIVSTTGDNLSATSPALIVIGIIVAVKAFVCHKSNYE